MHDVARFTCVVGVSAVSLWPVTMLGLSWTASDISIGGAVVYEPRAARMLASRVAMASPRQARRSVTIRHVSLCRPPVTADTIAHTGFWDTPPS